jgi:hypothetical protein
MIGDMASSTALALSIVAAGFALTAASTPAHADTPAIGDSWVWPTIKGSDWLEGTPSGNDAAGKVVVHWFCKAKVDDCTIDLARVYNMREQGNVYVIAYINGSKRDAKKLDPVRGDVGAGAVAFGKSVSTLFKKMGIGAALPMSIVVDVDGKVALVTFNGDPDQLDLRDKKVTSLIEAIKMFSIAGTGPSHPIKKGERFELSVTAEIAPWLTFDESVKPEIALTVPPDVTCEQSVLRGSAIKKDGRKLTAAVGCRGAVKGSYEATGRLRFSYRAPNKAVGIGQDGVRWKFVVVP